MISALGRAHRMRQHQRRCCVQAKEQYLVLRAIGRLLREEYVDCHHGGFLREYHVNNVSEAASGQGQLSIASTVSSPIATTHTSTGDGFAPNCQYSKRSH